MLRDRLVFGVVDRRLQNSFLRETMLTYVSARDMALAAEAADKVCETGLTVMIAVRRCPPLVVTPRGRWLPMLTSNHGSHNRERGHPSRHPVMKAGTHRVHCATAVVVSMSPPSVGTKITNVDTATRRDTWLSHVGRRLRTRPPNKLTKLTLLSQVTRSTRCTPSATEQPSHSR